VGCGHEEECVRHSEPPRSQEQAGEEGGSCVPSLFCITRCRAPASTVLLGVGTGAWCCKSSFPLSNRDATCVTPIKRGMRGCTALLGKCVRRIEGQLHNSYVHTGLGLLPKVGGRSSFTSLWPARPDRVCRCWDACAGLCFAGGGAASATPLRGCHEPTRLLIGCSSGQARSLCSRALEQRNTQLCADPPQSHRPK
jgi:hypothetical protein